MEFGAKLAGETGPLLSAAGKAASATLPGLQEAAKARRAEQREAISVGAQRELGRNKEQRELLSTGLGMVEKAGGFAEAAKTREFQDKWQRMDDTTKRYLGQLSANTQIQVGSDRNKSITNYQAKAAEAFKSQALIKATDAATKALSTNPSYRRLVSSKAPEDRQKAAKMFADFRHTLAQGLVDERLGGAGLTSGDEGAIDFDGLE
jgi:hypothetical protein